MRRQFCDDRGAVGWALTIETGAAMSGLSNLSGMSASAWRRVIPVFLPSLAVLAFLAAAFFAAVAGGGASPAFAGPAACSQSGGVATCTGNQSQGIQSGVDFSASDTILNVPSVSGSITPPVDTNGILFSGATTVEINSNVSNITINGYGDGVLGVAPGAVDIDHSGNIYNAFRGINGNSTNGNVIITDSGLIDNATEAAINGYAPKGSVTIGFDGRITNAQNRGISGVAATTSGTGTVSITSNADITAVNQAIYGLSVGGTTITSDGNIHSTSSRGISAEASGGVASIDSTGDVESADSSLYARSTGGNASATSDGDVTSHTNTGIDVESTVGTATINSAGDISAANQGLFAYGATGASITSDGDVTTGSTGNDAIFAFSSSGPASVTSHGDIKAPNGRGVVAISNGGTATTSIYSDGKVTAKGDGVYAQGGGAVTVTQYGDVSSTMGNGISAYGSAGAVSITGTGDVTAHVNGIIANTTTGNATIDHTGDVTATGGQGVRAQTSNGTASVVQNGDVTATLTNAVVAYSGNGAASAAVTGNIQTGGNGIEVDSTAGNATITGSGTINANTYALFANAQTSGAASITHSGDVMSVVGTAIEADATNGNITIDQTGDSTGALFGIKAVAEGANNVVTVTSKGDVNATQGDAIYAEAMGTGGTASVNSTGDVHADRFWNGTVYIGNSGILVRTDGNGSVTSHGDVSSRMADAINVQSQSGTATVTSVGTISAANQGIFAYGKTGASIDSTGAVTTGNDALFAFASGSSSPANVTVTSVGDVTSTLARGIVAITNSGGDATITSTGKVDASVEGVTAFTFGNGNASVTQTGDVISHTSTGIKAHAGGNGNATVTSNGDVTAQVEAVTAYVADSGNATVNQTGDVTSSQASGVVAQVGSNGDATITLHGNVQAKTQGVSAFVAGNGNASVTQTGNVTSSGAFGIRADALGNGNATINGSGTVQAKEDGVTADVHTSGSAEVDFTGDVTSNESTGIAAIAAGTGNATIDASGTVHSALESLLAVAGTGTASITYDGTVTSSGTYGVNAVTTDGNVVVDFTGGDITSGLFGIQGIARGNNRSADITFDGGTITALTTRGIYGEALGTGSTVTISSTGDINAGDFGIFAHANGAAKVTSTGDVDTTTGSGRGIFAWSDAGLASITSTGNVTSTDVALYAVGVGATIDSTGTVTATSGDAVYAQTTGIGDASVTSRGDVTSNNSRGIVVINSSAALGSVLIDSVGKITANDTALVAFTEDGNATVHSTGDVSSTVNQGIQAQSLSNGYALITSTGDVNSKNVGIIAQASSGSATITQTGDVTTDHTGIEAISELGSATITSTGTVDVRLEGLKALANNENTGSGSASITQVGNVTSSDSFGINSDAWGTGGNSTVNVTGDVHAYETAIQSMAFGGNATASITSVGAVTSDLSNGIQSQAEGSGSKAIINAQGDVNSKFISVFGLADSDVTIDYTGNATSTNSDALLAQSNSGAVTIHSNGNLTGNSVDATDARHGLFALGYGLVDVTQVGDVTTSSNERAIQAQSTNGNVKLDVTGNVHVNGTGGDSDAIFAYAPNGHADVTIRAGSVITGGTDPLASFGVEFGSATGTNTLTNYGEINNAHGGKTIGGATAADVVENYGLVNGDFYLAGGANRFDNLAGGWTYFKTYSQVGVGNDFNNTGSVTPAAPMVIGSSVLDGNFKQTGTGTFWADLDYGNSSNVDYLDVTGNVTAGGNVHVYVTNLGLTAGPVTATIIHSTGTVTNAGIAGVDQGPLMVDVSTTPTTVVINAAIDFGVDNGLSSYSQPVGDFLQNLFTSTVGGGLTPDQEAYYLGLINYGDTAAYDSFLSVPATTAASLHEVYGGASGFADNLFSCRQAEGANRFVAEGSCVWTAGGFRSVSQNATDDAVAFDDSAFSLSGGQQFAVNPNWAMGFGVGFENGNGTSPAGLTLDRNIFSAGLVAKGTFGAMQFAGAVTGGGGTIDSTREVAFPVPGTVTGDRGIGFLGVTGRASYTKDMGSIYLKPMLEAAATYIGAGAYTESGGGVGDYAFDAVNQFVGRGTLSVELGGQFAAGDNIQLRPYISAGLTLLGGQNVDVTAGIPGLGAGTFTTSTSGDSIYADLKAGVYAFGGTGWSTRLEYDGRLSANSAQHSGSLKLSVPF